jgi:hypothetical protein
VRVVAAAANRAAGLSFGVNLHLRTGAFRVERQRDGSHSREDQTRPARVGGD